MRLGRLLRELLLIATPQAKLEAHILADLLQMRKRTILQTAGFQRGSASVYSKS